ncbi:MAG TPA: hypothetical protein PLO43_04465, partial [Chlamydiales bacterium]|nr:hypothetical protein [Chlamydiales bacterium]
RFESTPHTLLDLEDNTPLHYAVRHRNYPLSRLLIQKGAIQSFNRVGQTPKTLAEADEGMQTILADQNLYGRYQLALEKQDEVAILKSAEAYIFHLMSQSHFHSALKVLLEVEPLASSNQKGLIVLRQAICHQYTGDLEASEERLDVAIAVFSKENSSFTEFLKALKTQDNISLNRLDLQNGLGEVALNLLKAFGRKVSVNELKLGENRLSSSFFEQMENYFLDIKHLDLWSCHLYDRDAYVIASPELWVFM